MPPREAHWDFDAPENWKPEWTGPFDRTAVLEKETRIDGATAWMPYLLVGALLVATRLQAIPLAGWLKSVSLDFPNIFGTEISASVQPLYLPGTVFIVVSAITFFLHRMDWPSYRSALRKSGRTLIAASVALVFTVPMVQVFINSDGGEQGYPKMPIVLAEGMASLAGDAWPIFAPLIGGIGAFVAGSNTVSNMMFSLFQFGVGDRIQVDPTWIVALQAVGGAAGNMICVHNVVAACAVVGLVGREGAIIRKTLLPFVYYAFLPGAIGYAIVWHESKGIINIGTILAALILAGIVLAMILGRRPVAPATHVAAVE